MKGAQRFEGKHVLVTAAGAGFGRATAQGFADEGAATVCLVEKLADRLDAVAADVEERGAHAVRIEADLSDTASTRAALDATLAAVDGLDILVSNHAAMSWFTAYVDLAEEEWSKELAVNLTSHHVLAQGAARHMIERGGGVIMFTASVNAAGAGRGFAPYCVSKAGLIALSQVMAVELAEYGIRVNCVSPGPADTQRSVDLVGEEAMGRFRESFPGVPQNRLASPEDIAEAFLYLASDGASYVTGQNLIVDGGLTAQIYEVPD